MPQKSEILITGGAGFIGSHVCDLLESKGHQVIVVDNLSSGNNDFLSPKTKFYNMDVNSPNLEKVFEENNIEYVFHFAAQASVSVSTQNPVLDANENIIGSVNLMSLAKKFGVAKIVVASTAAVYGIPEFLPVDEKHSTQCLSFYGLSKLTMEKYVELFGLDFVIFRFSNVYGPRQSAHGEAGVVSIFADKMKKNEDITIHGDGNQTRDFIYVHDVARACLAAIESGVKNEIINVSTNKAISINKLFELLALKFNYRKQPAYADAREGDIKHSVLDNRKCSKLFGISHETSLSEGLTSLVF